METNAVEKISLSDWIKKLLSEDQLTFTIEEAMRTLGVDRSAILGSAQRLQTQRRLIRLRVGFYLIVPPRYFNMGAPPPTWYIDDLMQYENRPYYIALRKAAEYHGATHHGVMEFQVMTNKIIPSIGAGRGNIVFYYRKDINSIKYWCREKRKFRDGSLNISSPELTAFELLCYSRSIGTINNISTVIVDLGEVIKTRKLVLLSRKFKRPIIQRLGYLLDWLGFDDLTIDLKSELGKYKNNWTELDPYLARNKEFAPNPIERNQKWHVIVRREPDPDY